MNIFTIVSALPQVFEIIKLVEKELPKGTGDAKKDMFIDILKSMISDFQSIEAPLRKIADVVVFYFNKTGVFSKDVVSKKDSS
jgi:hypothetical protein